MVRKRKPMMIIKQTQCNKGVEDKQKKFFIDSES